VRFFSKQKNTYRVLYHDGSHEDMSVEELSKIAHGGNGEAPPATTEISDVAPSSEIGKKDCHGEEDVKSQLTDQDKIKDQVDVSEVSQDSAMEGTENEIQTDIAETDLSQSLKNETVLDEAKIESTGNAKSDVIPEDVSMINLNNDVSASTEIENQDSQTVEVDGIDNQNGVRSSEVIVSVDGADASVVSSASKSRFST
jgi:hypothetical protein